MPTDGPVPEVTDQADLYSLPLDQFTAARDILARWLRSQDRGDEAATVGKLRKPSVAAWALNQASRGDPALVERLRESHRLLREANSVEELQSASEARRRAVSSLVEAAVDELHADGRPDSPQTRDRINSTLLALATDPVAEAQLEEGRLIQALEPSGAGWGEMGLTPIPVDPRQDALAAVEEARARANRLEKEAAEAERRLEIAERAVKEARRRAKTARAQFEEASSEAIRAEEAVGDNPSKG
ncbi:MAG TPA: hypothetical protein VF148_08315 [Acidimicrobiia bacterium]